MELFLTAWNQRPEVISAEDKLAGGMICAPLLALTHDRHCLQGDTSRQWVSSGAWYCHSRKYLFKLHIFCDSCGLRSGTRPGENKERTWKSNLTCQPPPGNTPAGFTKQRVVIRCSILGFIALKQKVVSDPAAVTAAWWFMYVWMCEQVPAGGKKSWFTRNKIKTETQNQFSNIIYSIYGLEGTCEVGALLNFGPRSYQLGSLLVKMRQPFLLSSAESPSYKNTQDFHFILNLIILRTIKSWSLTFYSKNQSNPAANRI